MIVSGIKYYNSINEEYKNKPFIQYIEFIDGGKKSAYAYYEFDFNDLDKYTNLLIENYYKIGKLVYEYKNGKSIYLGKALKPAKADFKKIYKCYNNINYYNNKYSSIKNTIIKIGKNLFGFKRFRYCNNLDYTLPFAIKENIKDSNKKIPLFIFFHGYGIGDDKCIQPIIQSYFFSRKINKLKENNLILIPSLPKLMGFNINKKAYHNNYETTFGGLLDGLINKLKEIYNIDNKKIYILGVSNGGFGVISQLYIHPEKYAAGISLMGAGDLELDNFILNLNKTPLWLVHSKNDKKVPIGKGAFFGSDLIVEEYKKNNLNNYKYTRYKKYGHSSYIPFLLKEKWLEWLISK